MKVNDFLQKSEYTLEDIKDFCDGVGNFEQLRKEMNDITCFEHSSLNLNTLDEYSDEDLLNAEIFDA